MCHAHVCHACDMYLCLHLRLARRGIVALHGTASEFSLSELYSLWVARAGRPHSGGSQFFMNLNHNANLDWFSPGASKHPVFGQITEGYEIAVEISKVPTTHEMHTVHTHAPHTSTRHTHLPAHTTHTHHVHIIVAHSVWTPTACPHTVQCTYRGHIPCTHTSSTRQTHAPREFTTYMHMMCMHMSHTCTCACACIHVTYICNLNPNLCTCACAYACTCACTCEHVTCDMCTCDLQGTDHGRQPEHADYDEVDQDLWALSSHWPEFREFIFAIRVPWGYFRDIRHSGFPAFRLSGGKPSRKQDIWKFLGFIVRRRAHSTSPI
jgi:hypothetical protein